jgi:hypothetical protein
VPPRAGPEAREAAFRVDSAGQAAVNEATNVLNGEQTALLLRRAMLEALPQIIAAASKPMENIDKISIVDARGLHGETGTSDGSGVHNGNLADAAVAAAMRYRAGGPLIDALMGELGMDGRSLNGLLAGGTSALQPASGHVEGQGSSGREPATRKANVRMDVAEGASGLTHGSANGSLANGASPSA